MQCLIGGTRLAFALPSCGILAIAGVLAIGSLRQPRKTPDFACLAVSAVFFSYVLVRAVCSPWDYLWWMDFVMVVGGLMVYLLTAIEVPGARWRSVIVGALLVLAVAEFLVGTRQFTQLDNWMPFGFIRGDSGGRASGMFISPIHLAGYLEAAGAFALSFAVWSRWATWARVLTGYVALLCFAGVAITGSRGGYLSSVAAFGAFAALSLAVVKRTQPQRFRAVLTIVTVAGVLGIVGAGALMGRSPLLRKRLELMTEKNVRIYNWQAALDQFRLAPALGTGAGTHVYYGRLFRREQLQSDPIHAHNDYLELLAEYGLVGGAGMAAFLFVHLRHGLRKFSSIVAEFAELAPYTPVRHDVLALLIGALTAVAAYLVHSVCDFNLHIPGNTLTFAFIFGILAGPARGAAAEPANTRRAVPFRLVAPLLGGWLLATGAWETARSVKAGRSLAAPWPWRAAMILPRLPGEYWCEQARLALRTGQYQKAITLAGHALEFEQRNPDLYFHLGEAYRGLSHSPSDRATKQGRLEAALEAYRHSLAIFPFDEHVLVRLGQASDDLGRFSEAREAYETAIRHDPKLGILHAYFARHLTRVGRAEEAGEHRELAKQLGAQDLRPILGEAFLAEPDEPERLLPPSE
jgi:O-antigen ligase